MKTEVILKWGIISEAWGPNSLHNFYISEDNIMWEAKGGGRNMLLKAWYSNGLKYQDRIFLCVSQKKNITFLYLCSPSL